MVKTFPEGNDRPVSIQEPFAAAAPDSPSPSVPRTGDAWFSKPMRIVWVVLLLYAAGFFCFYPKALTNFDEVYYVRQAAAFSHGSSTVDITDAYTGAHHRLHPSDYPPATSAVMTPFVWVAGWRGAFALGLVAIGACVLFTARWIAASGGSPLYALFILGYVPALVMARIAMSDVPSACLVAAGLWLFWSDNEPTGWRRFAAGFLAGVSVCFREPNPILFVFFFAGALLRRERHLPALVAGGIAGVACRLIGAALVYGDPLFTKVQFYGFTGLYLAHNLVMYLTGLLILVPGGLILALAYRGRRRPELVSTVAVFVGMFLIYNYNGSASGGLKQWILTLRFMIPLLPIVAFAMAETCPRWYSALIQRVKPERRAAWHSITRAAIATWLCGIVIMSFLVNWRSGLLGQLHQDLIHALYSNTEPSTPLVADIPASLKFLNELNGQRVAAELTGISDNEIGVLLDRHKAIQIVFLDRNDSDYWVLKWKDNQRFLRSLSPKFVTTLHLERKYPGVGVLQIWNVAKRS
jgi:hypothetical protein